MSRIRPPKKEHVSIRTSAENKRKAQLVKEATGYTDEDMWLWGLNKAANRLSLLEFEKGEKELQIASLKNSLYKKEAELIAINNEIRMIEPRKLDAEELASLIGEASHDYAKEIFESRGVDGLKAIESDNGKSAVFKYGRKQGFDGSDFYDLVYDHLKIMCNTKL